MGVSSLIFLATCSQEQSSNTTQREPTRQAQSYTTTPISGEEAIVAEDIVAGEPAPPEYQVTRKGDLIVGGDVVFSCADVAERGTFHYETGEAEQLRKEYAKVCAKAGFPPGRNAR